MPVVKLSSKCGVVVAHERDAVASRVEGLRRQSETLHALVDTVDEELRSSERLLRRMNEALGLAPQLPLDSLREELRGERLRDVAIDVLRQRKGVGAEIHYTDWLQLLEQEGIRVGGKDPHATLLTQIARSPHVEAVRPRSGLYRLKAA